MSVNPRTMEVKCRGAKKGQVVELPPVLKHIVAKIQGQLVWVTVYAPAYHEAQQVVGRPAEPREPEPDVDPEGFGKLALYVEGVRKGLVR